MFEAIGIVIFVCLVREVRLLVFQSSYFLYEHYRYWYWKPNIEAGQMEQGFFDKQSKTRHIRLRCMP